MKQYLWFSVILLPILIGTLFLARNTEEDNIGEAGLTSLVELKSGSSVTKALDGKNIAVEAIYHGAFEGPYVGSLKESAEDVVIAIEFASDFEVPSLSLFDSLPIETPKKRALEGYPKMDDLIRLRGVFHSSGNYPLGINLGGAGSAWIEVSEFYRWNKHSDDWQRVYSLR